MVGSKLNLPTSAITSIFTDMLARHIHIEGQVQGVGFRPFVYRLAMAMGIQGWVNNGVDGVHVEACGRAAQLDDFCRRLADEAPSCAVITHFTITDIPLQQYPDFSIKTSLPAGRPSLLLTPDMGLCDNCRHELSDAGNRRFHYAFTTCTYCGPRYSIIRRLPYDRELTSMATFEMCPDCLKEYNNPLDRRYYSQTNSCPACPVSLQLLDKQGNILSDHPEDIISRSAALLLEGRILAVKGIGGYLLMADAANREAMQTLRERKNRPSKPFALLYPNADMLAGDVFLSPLEKGAFSSVESPILLLTLRQEPAGDIQADLIAPHLNQIGAMQPYTPLLEWLSNEVNRPLVATSGNISGSPIYYDDEEALACLAPLADFFVVNDRVITTPQDDSVVRYAPESGRRIVVRRSRGYAPTLIGSPLDGRSDSLLAMGADMKSAFSLLHQGNVYVSQYLGDLDNFDTQRQFRHTMHHLIDLLQAQPREVLTDLHPRYYSTELGEATAGELSIPTRGIQHHQAHFAAVLAENDLINTTEPVLGVIWDGTGWGSDNQIWGGEFFLYSRHTMKRVAHLSYFPHFLGDKMAKEPRLSALALASHHPEALKRLRPVFDEQEWNVYLKMLAREPALLTSSAGRLFDAVAALIGVQFVSSFEGEAAMRLEAMAGNYYRQKGLMKTPYRFNKGHEFDLQILVDDILEDLRRGRPADFIAARFHWSLAISLLDLAEHLGVQRLAFSGGVFQNALLIDLITKELSKKYQLFFHKQLSPNDECVSFGQLAYACIQDDRTIGRSDYWTFSHKPINIKNQTSITKHHNVPGYTR